MADELVDFISEDGKIIKSVSKYEAHEKGLLHGCVIALLFNSKDDLMLIKPPSTKQDAGKYVCPVGGHISSDESEIEALKREVEEEIGLNDFKYKRIGQAIFARHVLGRHENHLFVMFEIYSDQKPTAGTELESMHWFKKESLKTKLKDHPKDFGDAFYFVFEHFYKN
ncbi:hypothetical protein BH09PAT1_BH09PAT1_8300 [soil metagenome]